MKTNTYKGIEYRKNFDILTGNVISVLSNGEFPVHDSNEWSAYLNDTYMGDRFLGLIEFPTIDIELEAYTGGGDEPYTATIEDNKIMLLYFVCIKGLYKGEEGWNSDDSAGRCTVDFSADDWEQRLTQEMCERLDAYAERYGYSFTEYNFDYN